MKFEVLKLVTFVAVLVNTHALGVQLKVDGELNLSASEASSLLSIELKGQAAAVLYDGLVETGKSVAVLEGGRETYRSDKGEVICSKEVKILPELPKEPRFPGMPPIGGITPIEVTLYSCVIQTANASVK